MDVETGETPPKEGLQPPLPIQNQGDNKGKPDNLDKLEVRKKRIRQREESLNLATDLKKGYRKTFELILKDQDFQRMRIPYKRPFFEAWTTGFTHYLAGEWEAAKLIFEQTLVICSKIDHVSRHR